MNAMYQSTKVFIEAFTWGGPTLVMHCNQGNGCKLVKSFPAGSFNLFRYFPLPNVVQRLNRHAEARPYGGLEISKHCFRLNHI